MPDHLAADLERTIDQFVTSLKQQLANPMTGPDAQRGVWDRMKNWWSNMWHGRYNQQNPYFWQNKLGDDLGRTTESVQRIPLEHYKFLHEQTALLENGLAPGAEKLQVIRVVDQWAKQFKNAVMTLMARHHGPVANPYAPSSSDHEVPTVGHEPEEERDDSHIHGDEEHEEPAAAEPTRIDDLETRRHELMEKLKPLKGKMGADAYERAKNAILTGDENALNQAEKFMTSRTAVLDDGDEEPSPAPTPAPRTTPPAADDPSVKAPAADKRQWKELSVNEREQWDAAGGGHAHAASFHARNKFDIKGLPWILRIGDPRLTHLESIPGRQLYSRLVRQKRIELPGNPIRTPEQLAKAVEEAKRLHGEEYDATSTDRTERHKKRTAAKPPVTDPLAPAPKRTASLDPDPTPPEVTPVAPAGRTAPLPDPVAPGSKKKKGGSGKLKPPRTAPMSESPPEEEAVNTDELKSDLESIKGEIDDAVFTRLQTWLEKGMAGEKEYLKGVKDKVKTLKEMIAAKKAESDDGGHGLAQIESTIREKTAFLVFNFRHRVNESNKEVSIQGSKKKKNVFHSRLSME
jgi:hypothetical protein